MLSYNNNTFTTLNIHVIINSECVPRGYRDTLLALDPKQCDDNFSYIKKRTLRVCTA